MRIEALGWSLLEMLTAPLARELRRRAPEFARSWEALGGWTRDLLLPYLALIAGSISAREAGVANLPELARWPAAVACLAGIGAAWFAAPHLPQHPQPHASALEALRLEPRLALYRAAAATWLPEPNLSIAAGVIAGAIEWTLAGQPWQAQRLDGPARAGLARILFSGLIFWATRSFWLTAGLQATLIWTLDRRMRSAENSPAPAEGKESQPTPRQEAA